jgi:hypothetical protein
VFWYVLLAVAIGGSLAVVVRIQRREKARQATAMGALGASHGIQPTTTFAGRPNQWRGTGQLRGWTYDIEFFSGGEEPSATVVTVPYQPIGKVVRETIKHDRDHPAPARLVPEDLRGHLRTLGEVTIRTATLSRRPKLSVGTPGIRRDEASVTALTELAVGMAESLRAQGRAV